MSTPTDLDARPDDPTTGTAIYSSYPDMVRGRPDREARRIKRKVARLQDRTTNRGNLRGLIMATVGDFRVLESLWTELLDLILATKVSRLEAAVRTWSRDNGLQGMPAQHRPPLVRVRSRGAAENDFVAQERHPDVPAKISAATARDIMDDLVSETRWRVGVRRAMEHRLHLGRHVQWATFNSRGAHPYAGLDGMTAAAVACDLGFDRSADGTAAWEADLPLLLMEYSARGLDLRFPTMTEAWHPDAPNYYFTVAVDGSDWGQTRVWPDRPHGSRGGRPEVVHEPPRVDSLGAPVAEVWG